MSAGEAPATARLLARSGFRRAHVEVGWGSLSYDHPDTIVGMAELRTRLRALKTNGTEGQPSQHDQRAAAGPVHGATLTQESTPRP